MAQGKGGGLATLTMVGAFVVIGVVMFALSVVGGGSPPPGAIEAPAAEAPVDMPAAESASPDTATTEAPAAN